MKNNAGNCLGHGHIATISECEVAAIELGLSDTAASEGTGGSNYPQGCYYEGSSSNKRLWFNSNGESLLLLIYYQFNLRIRC